ncbi:hypothetical protein KR018_000135 [Drosophila ironensis]|nr:hypothetical protein KR018_000135 [Drosophila ironensis]
MYRLSISNRGHIMVGIRRLFPLSKFRGLSRTSTSGYGVHHFMDFAGPWPADERRAFKKDMQVLPDFITTEEEEQLLLEIEPHMKRLPYEANHWDEAIHGYREAERRTWSAGNRVVLERISQLAFGGRAMPFVHILDLAESGVIKPHVDSTRFCGNTIAGLSLLSDSVMRLVRAEQGLSYSADLLLPRRSLYVMTQSARFLFTHEILDRHQSIFAGESVSRRRRLSVICRNEP